MMKRTIINMMMVLGSAIAMVSCDTRKDVFDDIEERLFIIAEWEDGTIDTLSSSPNNTKANINMQIKEIGDRTIKFGEYSFKLYVVIDGRKLPIKINVVNDVKHIQFDDGILNHSWTSYLTYTNFEKDEEYSHYKEEHNIKITANWYPSDEDNPVTSWFNSDGTARKVLEVNLYIGLVLPGQYDLSSRLISRDAYVKVNYWSEDTPVPILEAKPITGQPMAWTLSLKNSYDTDGEVKKYEYCIDGNVTQYSHDIPHFEAYKHYGKKHVEETIWEGGKAAYGGTYITATELSEVKHVFQTKGEHKIYYRCMDNLGLWSLWQCETIEIE